MFPLSGTITFIDHKNVAHNKMKFPYLWRKLELAMYQLHIKVVTGLRNEYAGNDEQ